MEKLLGRYIAKNYNSHSYSRLYLLVVYFYVYFLRKNKDKQEVQMLKFGKKKHEMDMTLTESTEEKIETSTVKISSCAVLTITGHILMHTGFIIAGNILSGIGLLGFSFLLIRSAVKRHQISSDTPEKSLAA